MKKRINIFTFAIVLFTSLTVMGVAAKHFWDVIIDNDLDVVGTIGGSGTGVKFDEFLNMQQEVTPANPAASEHRIYFKADGSLYQLDSAGIEKKIGSGVGGGGGGVNILAESNFNCEDGDPPIDWVNSGATFSAETTNPGFDAASCKWDASAASQLLRTAAVNVPDGLEGRACQAEFQYKWNGSAGDIDWRVETSGEVLIVNDMELSVSAGWAKAIAFFTCPSTSDLRIEWESTADAAELLVDNAFIGQMSTVATSVVVTAWESFTPTYVNDDGCSFTHDNFRWRRVAENMEIRGTSTAGAACTSGSSLQLVLPVSGVTVNFGAGDRPGGTVTTFDHQNDNVYETNAVFPAAANTLGFVSNKDGSFNAGTDYILGSALHLEVDVQINEWDAEPDESITLETTGFHVDVNIGGANPDMLLVDVSSYSDINDTGLDMVVNSGSADAQIPCTSGTASSGLTCSAAAESVGVVFDAPSAGRYKACASFSHFMRVNSVTDSVPVAFQLVETSNTATTILQEGGTRVLSSFTLTAGAGDDRELVFPHKVCGNFTFSSAGQKTLRLMREQNISGTPLTNVLLMDRDASTGQRDMHITVEKMDQQFPAPVFPILDTKVDGEHEDGGSVGIEYFQSAAATCTSSPCALSNKSAGVDEVTRQGTGDYNIEWVAGTWATGSEYVCICSNKQGAAVVCPTATTANQSTQDFACRNSGTGALTDTRPTCVCMGKRP